MTENVLVTDPSGTTAWRRRTTPLKQFVETETGGSAVLLGAVLVAIAWANLNPHGYESFWQAHLSIDLAGHAISLSVRGWINSGLMACFFFVVGLEARREFDLGELRQRSRVALPLLAGLGGAVVPVLIYLSINAGEPSAHAWGAAMNTDTALALGVLTVAGRGLPGRLRVFLLTVSVVDDLLALAVISVVYSGHEVAGLAIGLSLGLVLLAWALNIQVGLVYFSWLRSAGGRAQSGVDPIVVGLAKA
jgi:Na+/H+ antiporter NhaA